MDERPEDIARWTEFYRTHSFAQESSFARFVHGFFPGPGVVVELGCGDGRDALYFARNAKQIVAADRAASAIDVARAKAGEGSGRSFHIGDVSDPSFMHVLLKDPILAQARGDEIVVYLRFFLHAVPLATEEILLDAVATHLPREHHLAAEFRTDEDALLAKAEGVHYRRFIAPDDMIGRLRRRGYSIMHSEVGRGLSKYRDEDPHLCRIVSRR